MQQGTDRFYVIIGGSGSGKSSLLEALHQRGYARSIEAGRGINTSVRLAPDQT